MSDLTRQLVVGAVPAALSGRLAACSIAELAVLWLAVSDLLDGLEKGRAQYGTEPGAPGRDYVAEAMDELRDGLLYLAMHRVQRGGEGVKP